MKLQGKTAIITGSARGIGKGIALAYAKEGANLVLNVYGVEQQEIAELSRDVSSYGGQVVIIEGDITKKEIVEEIVQTALSRFQTIDILVNNAGILTQSLLKDMEEEQWDQMINIDLKSVFLTIRAVVQYMIAQKSGRIINIASQIGQKGGVELSHYAAAKAGVIAFTKSIALELGKYNITANCIAPGPIQTQLVAEINEDWKSQKQKELACLDLAQWKKWRQQLFC